MIWRASWVILTRLLAVYLEYEMTSGLLEKENVGIVILSTRRMTLILALFNRNTSSVVFRPRATILSDALRRIRSVLHRAQRRTSIECQIVRYVIRKLRHRFEVCLAPISSLQTLSLEHYQTNKQRSTRSVPFHRMRSSLRPRVPLVFHDRTSLLDRLETISLLHDLVNKQRSTRSVAFHRMRSFLLFQQ